jgi:RNA polymerase sigma factor (sigma-70 family)
MTESQNTIELLRGWHGGNRQALDELIRRNLGWMQRHVRRRLGEELRRAGDTQDFVQDAMIQVLEYGPRFEVADEDQFRRLLARIVENSLRGKHRHMRRDRRDVRRERDVESDTVLSLDPPQREVTRPSQYADHHEQVAWVRLALEFLKPADREVIWLHQYHELSFPEIGSRLGASEDTVRMRFHRALPRLAKKVAELQKGRFDAVLDEVPGEVPYDGEVGGAGAE